MLVKLFQKKILVSAYIMYITIYYYKSNSTKNIFFLKNHTKSNSRQLNAEFIRRQPPSPSENIRCHHLHRTTLPISKSVCVVVISTIRHCPSRNRYVLSSSPSYDIAHLKVNMSYSFWKIVEKHLVSALMFANIQRDKLVVNALCP